MKIVKTLLIIIIFALIILVGLSYAGLLPVNIQNYFITKVDINIYTNDKLVASDQISSIDFPELKQGILPFREIYKDFYGTFLKGNTIINNEQGIFLDNGTTSIILTKDEKIPTSKNYILVNLYYEEKQQEPTPTPTPKEPEVKYGTIIIQIATEKPAQPYTNYSISLFGVKDTHSISQVYSFDENGLIIVQVDISYAWVYYFEGSSEIIQFDNENHFYDSIVVEEKQVTPDPLIIDELPEEHEVQLQWQYSDAATGQMIISEASFSAYAGEALDLEFYIYHPPGASLLDEENIKVEYNGDVYQLNAISKSGGSENSNWPLISDAPMNNFPMINDDLIITFHYEKTQA